MSFTAATAIEPRGGGNNSGRIAAGWDVVGDANGGYLMALAARAASQVAGGPVRPAEVRRRT